MEQDNSEINKNTDIVPVDNSPKDHKFSVSIIGILVSAFVCCFILNLHLIFIIPFAALFIWLEQKGYMIFKSSRSNGYNFNDTSYNSSFSSISSYPSSSSSEPSFSSYNFNYRTFK